MWDWLSRVRTLASDLKAGPKEIKDKAGPKVIAFKMVFGWIELISETLIKPAIAIAIVSATVKA